MQISSLIGHTKELLEIIFKSNRPADSIIDTFFRSHKYLGSHDRRFIAETTYGTLRHLRKCEFILNSTIESNTRLSEHDKTLLLIITYLFTQNKLNEIKTESILSLTKKLNLKINLDKFISNLSHIFEIKYESVIQRIGVEYSFPDWMIEKFIEQYGEDETEKICSSLNEQAPITIRVNTIKSNVEECQTELIKQGIDAKRTRWSPLGLNISKRMNVFSLQAFRDGWFEVQDEGSQLLPLIVNPKPKSKLLDLCAGAGGKTLEFSDLMKNRGEIFATDINGYRLDDLRRRMKRADAQNIRVVKINSAEDLKEKYAKYFDIVFIDAPCSGLGTIRRNPGMKWMVTEKTVNEVSEKQKTILESSVDLVKEGGKIIYATCTLLKQENEEIIEKFLLTHPEYKVVPSNDNLNNMRIESYSKDNFIKLLPHVHGTDGFFCAILQRTAIH